MHMLTTQLTCTPDTTAECPTNSTACPTNMPAHMQQQPLKHLLQSNWQRGREEVGEGEREEVGEGEKEREGERGTVTAEGGRERRREERA